jgi:hypothetical protein
MSDEGLWWHRSEVVLPQEKFRESFGGANDAVIVTLSCGCCSCGENQIATAETRNEAKGELAG